MHEQLQRPVPGSRFRRMFWEQDHDPISCTGPHIPPINGYFLILHNILDRCCVESLPKIHLDEVNFGRALKCYEQYFTATKRKQSLKKMFN